MIRVSELSKYFGGTRALGPVSFEIAPGETIGFLGLNGAGKTTLLRILACDLRPSAGSFAVGNVDGIADPHAVRKRIGFLPESPPVYPDMTVGDYLTFAGRIRGLPPSATTSRVREVEEVTHTIDVHDELIRHLSHGFRQRIGVAQAIVHQPEFLILDEPTNGLDPAQVVEMRAMIQDLKGKHTILISSHILPEIRETCDRLIVLGDGRLLASGSEDQLTSRLELRRIAVAVRAPVGDDAVAGAIRRCIESVAGVTRVLASGRDDGALSFHIDATGDCRAAVCRALVEDGHDVLRLDRATSELESVFLELVHGGEHASG